MLYYSQKILNNSAIINDMKIQTSEALFVTHFISLFLGITPAAFHERMGGFRENAKEIFLGAADSCSHSTRVPVGILTHRTPG